MRVVDAKRAIAEGRLPAEGEGKLRIHHADLNEWLHTREVSRAARRLELQLIVVGRAVCAILKTPLFPSLVHKRRHTRWCGRVAGSAAGSIITPDKGHYVPGKFHGRSFGTSDG